MIDDELDTVLRDEGTSWRTEQPAALVRVAQRYADGCGGGDYRATVVAATQGEVGLLIDAGTGAEDAVPVWAIEIVKTSGVFACPHSCPATPAQSACVSRVPVIVVTVTRNNYADLMYATQTDQADLSKLGLVIQIHP